MEITKSYDLISKIQGLHLVLHNKPLAGSIYSDLIARYNPEREAVDFLIAGYASKSTNYIFSAKGSSGVAVWFASAVHRIMTSSGLTESATCKITADGLEINHEIMFTILVHLYELVSVHCPKVKFPSYIRTPAKRMRNLTQHPDPKFGYYEKYLNKIKYIGNYLILEKNTPSDKIYVRTQLDALKHSKEMSTAQVIAYCGKLNNDSPLRSFSTEDAFIKSADDLFSLSVMLLKRPGQVAKKRISRKSALRYLKYLALMSTISTRAGRSIEINAAKEASVFKEAYKYYRDACMSKKWLEVDDPTFCRGIRCKSFSVRVGAAKSTRAKHEFSLNNLESEYMKAIGSEESAFVMANLVDSSDQYEYLNTRIKTYNEINNYKKMLYDQRSSFAKMSGSKSDTAKVQFWDSTHRLRSRRVEIREALDTFEQRYRERNRFDQQFGEAA